LLSLVSRQADPSRQRFANPENERLFVLTTVGSVIVFGSFSLLSAAKSPPLALLPVALGSAAIWLLHRAFRASYVEVSPDGVVVRNPFASIWLEWDEVVRLQGGRFLTIELVDGRVVRAWAVQSANWSLMSRRSGYADDVAKEISTRRGLLPPPHP
jgi:hypothetical protein